MVRLRLSAAALGIHQPFDDFDGIFTARHQETDAFYDAITPASVKANSDRCNILRHPLDEHGPEEPGAQQRLVPHAQ